MPISQFTDLRICSTPQALQQHVDTLKDRGYVDEQLNTAFNKVSGDVKVEKAPSSFCVLRYQNRAQQIIQCQKTLAYPNQQPTSW